MSKTTYYTEQLINSWGMESIIDGSTTELKDYYVIDFERQKVYTADTITIGQFKEIRNEMQKEDTEKKGFAIIKQYS